MGKCVSPLVKSATFNFAGNSFSSSDPTYYDVSVTTGLWMELLSGFQSGDFTSETYGSVKYPNCSFNIFESTTALDPESPPTSQTVLMVALIDFSGGDPVVKQNLKSDVFAPFFTIPATLLSGVAGNDLTEETDGLYYQAP